MSERRPTDVTEGRWAGWRYWSGLDAYEDLTGPYYFRADDDRPRLAVEVQRRHLNGRGAAHGGFLMTFADNALFSIAWPAIQETGGVTVHLSGDFTASAHEGDVLEATGEIVKAGGRMVFVRGVIKRDDVVILSFNGSIMKQKPKA